MPITGTVSGLAGSGLVLTNNGTDDLAITSDGPFEFARRVTKGEPYAITITAQPLSPAQSCTIDHATGKAGDAAAITVTCTTSSFAIGGTVTGLDGTGLVLQNGNDMVSISANGAFAFATPVTSGATYDVVVASQPSARTQVCTVTGGSGTVGNGDVTSIAVACTTTPFTIGGTVTGLAGTGLVLQDNSGDDLPISADGMFTFATPVASGDSYDVTVKTQPGMPWQTCTVGGGSGVVGADNVTSVTVNCATNRYMITGTVTGLAGAGLVLQNNGGDNRAISANGSFAFATTVASGDTYDVTVLTQPAMPWQTCTIANATGSVTDADVTDVAVTCTTNTYSVGVTVVGMTGTGLVVRDNGADDMTIDASGSYTFATRLASGTMYQVTIATQPSGEPCVVANPSGTIAGSNVNVDVVCGQKNWTTSLFPMVVPGSNYGLGEMAFDPAGNLLVTTTTSATGAVVRVDRITGAQTTVASNIGTGYLVGLTYSAATDSIYVNTDNGTMYRIDNTGTVSTFVATGVNQLDALAIAPASFGSYGGYIIGVSEYGTVIAVNPTTAAVTTLTTTGPAMSDLAFAPDGTLYVSGGPTISKMSATGVATTAFTGFSSADGITLSPDGTSLFVADSGTDQVIQVTRATSATTIVGSYNIDDGFFVGGILADPGNTVIVMTGETSLTLRAFTY